MMSRFTALLAVFLLSACAYAIESSNEEITFLTPGAQDAHCYVFVDGLKYQVLPPQTINIKKSSKDMKIECRAPGNRYIEMTVPSELSNTSLLGTPVGLAWDYASNSSHRYPTVIAIDFSQKEITPNKMPKHNNDDIKQPEEYDLEEYLPLDPLLNSDKNKKEPELLRRGAEEFEEMPYQEDVESGGKGDLQSVINNLVESDGSSAEGEPVQIYPGE